MKRKHIITGILGGAILATGGFFAGTSDIVIKPENKAESTPLFKTPIIQLIDGERVDVPDIAMTKGKQSFFYIQYEATSTNANLQIEYETSKDGNNWTLSKTVDIPAESKVSADSFMFVDGESFVRVHLTSIKSNGMVWFQFYE